jgi:hypothetical protein
MHRPLDPHGLLRRHARVEGLCITACGTVAEIATSRVPTGEVPACPECGNPMLVRALPPPEPPPPTDFPHGLKRSAPGRPAQIGTIRHRLP